MRNGQKVGYARVSTQKQDLSHQLDALRAAGCDQVFTDEGVSTARARDGLVLTLATVERGDTVVVWKLDRLGRSLSYLIEFIAELGNRGVQFVALHDAIDTTTSGGKLVFHIMGALVEFERDLNRERTVAGMNAARRRGKSVGRPSSLSPEQINHAKRAIEQGETVSAIASVLGVHRNTLKRAITD